MSGDEKCDILVSDRISNEYEQFKLNDYPHFYVLLHLFTVYIVVFLGPRTKSFSFCSTFESLGLDYV